VIEIIEGLPENVIGVVVRGRVTKQDCIEVLTPALHKACEWHQRLRLYYEIRSRFPGAAWEEIDLGFGHGWLWERVAVVSDVAWVRHAIQALRLVIPAEIQVFTASQVPEGLAWIASSGRPSQRGRRSAAVPALNSHSSGRRAYLPALQFLHQG